EIEEAALVGTSQVSGVKPAVSHHLAGRLRTVQVTAEHPRALHNELAGLPDGDVVSGLVDDPQGELRDRDADRTRSDHLVRVLERHSGDEVSLADAVALDPWETPPLHDLAMKVNRHREMPGDSDPIVTVPRIGWRLQEEERDGGEAEDLGHLVIPYDIPEARDAEAPHHDERAADLETL